MQIVINISDEKYKQLRNEYYGENEVNHWLLMECAMDVLNGVLLPKGHGRLGDLDALEKEMTNGINAGNYEEGYETFAHVNNMDDCVECVKYADTIIEADKESEDVE